MISQTFTYEFLVREAHLDTFGHVNNAEYLRLFEEARWELITTRGYGIARIKETGIGPVLLEVTLKFKRELKLRQHIRIETRVELESEKIFKIYQQMIDTASGKVHCDAVITSGVFDTTQRKLVAPSEEWKRAVGL